MFSAGMTDSAPGEFGLIVGPWDRSSAGAGIDPTSAGWHPAADEAARPIVKSRKAASQRPGIAKSPRDCTAAISTNPR